MMLPVDTPVEGATMDAPVDDDDVYLKNIITRVSQKDSAKKI
jgi:hypothetical protein